MVIEKKNNKYESPIIFILFCILSFAFIVESNPNYKIKETIFKNTETSGDIIGQVIDGFYDNKYSDPSGVVPCHFLRSASSDEKLSIPITVERELHPTSYCVKFESYADMRNLISNGKYETRPFAAGGYNWTFLIYPTGKDTVNGWVSVEAKIDTSTLITNPEDVYAELKFFVYNKNLDRYWIRQETDAMRFHLFNSQLGFPTFRAMGDFTNPNLGYIFDGGQSVFGIDVFVAQPFKSWEVFSFVNNTNAIHTWEVREFSSLFHTYYRSGWFVLEGKSWDLQLYPNGDGSGQGNSLSLYLLSGSNEETYVKAKLRIVDQLRNNDEEKEVEGWPSAKPNGWGFEKFISLGDLKDEKNGFIVNDVLRIQVEILACTKTDFIN